MKTESISKNEAHFFSPLVWILIIVVASLLVVRIFIANQLATTGALANARSMELENLRADNQKLINEVSVLGSIQHVAAKAGKIGLKASPKVEVLRTNSGVAFGR